MFTLFLIIVIVVCLVIIGFIIVPKLSQLKSVNVQSAPNIKQSAVKQRILEERFVRNLQSGWQKFFKVARPAGEWLGSQVKSIYHSLVDLEEKYRHQAIAASFKDRLNQQQTVQPVIKEAYRLFAAGNLAEAERKLIEVLKLDSHNIEAYEGLGELYLSQKNYEQAKETFEFLIKLKDSDPYIYRALGEIYYQIGDLKQAETQYLQSLAINSDQVDVYLDLAQIYVDLDEANRGFEMASKAALLEPNNPRVLDYLIEISIIVRDKAAAFRAFNQLREVNPDNQKLAEFKEQIEKL